MITAESYSPKAPGRLLVSPGKGTETGGKRRLLTLWMEIGLFLREGQIVNEFENGEVFWGSI